MYKKDRFGNEFYNKHQKFKLSNRKDEVYAKDSKGNEIYPGCKVARNSWGQLFYAKLNNGSEYYPSDKYGNVMFMQNDGKVLIARLNSTCQRYPRNKNGIEYYPINYLGKPFYLRNSSGSRYYPTLRNNIPLAIEDVNNYVYKKIDTFGNEIYTTDPKLGRKFKTIDFTILSLVFLGNLPIIISILLATVI